MVRFFYWSKRAAEQGHEKGCICLVLLMLEDWERRKIKKKEFSGCVGLRNKIAQSDRNNWRARTCQVRAW